MTSHSDLSSQKSTLATYNFNLYYTTTYMHFKCPLFQGRGGNFLLHSYILYNFVWECNYILWIKNMQSKSKFLFRLLNVKNERENKRFSQILGHRIEKKINVYEISRSGWIICLLFFTKTVASFFKTNDKYVYFFLLSRKYTELLIFRGGNLD